MDDLATLFEIADMLAQFEASLEQLEVGGMRWAGDEPENSENRAVVAAQMSLLRQKTQTMRAEVAAVRLRSAQMAHDALAQRTRPLWRHAAGDLPPPGTPTRPDSAPNNEGAAQDPATQAEQHTPGTGASPHPPRPPASWSAGSHSPSWLSLSHRRLALALRASRQHARMSQLDLATALAMTPTRVARLEQCLALPTQDEAQRWRLVTGPDLPEAGDIEALLDSATLEQVPWAELLYAPQGHLQHHVAADEKAARSLLSVSLTSIPGLLQTRDYARSWIPAVDVSGTVDRRAALEARLERQRVLGEEGREIVFLLAEHVVDHADDIAPGQRAHIENVSEMGGVHIGVLPSSSLTCRTGFTLYRRKVASAAPHVAVELLHRELVINHPRLVALYDHEFERLRLRAVPLRAHLDRSR